jgi:hypothetical protein
LFETHACIVINILLFASGADFHFILTRVIAWRMLGLSKIGEAAGLRTLAKPFIAVRDAGSVLHFSSARKPG